MDKSREFYTEQNKLGRKRKLLCYLSDMYDLKTIKLKETVKHGISVMGIYW